VENGRGSSERKEEDGDDGGGFGAKYFFDDFFFFFFSTFFFDYSSECKLSNFHRHKISQQFPNQSQKEENKAKPIHLSKR
jgi:hypothetical protein